LGPSTFLASNLVVPTNLEVSFNVIGITLILGRFGFFGVVLFLLCLFGLYKHQSNTAGKFFVGFILFDFLIYSGAFFLSYLPVYVLVLLQGIQNVSKQKKYVEFKEV
jgi:hypothetical protein